MAHEVAQDQTHTVRVLTVAIVWVCGLGAGVVAILAAVARYGCAPGRHTLGCRPTGSGLGVALLVGAIVVVAAVTLLASARSPRQVMILGAAGVILLLACYLGAQGLLDSA